MGRALNPHTKKDVWSAHLIRERQYATGKLAPGTVFLVVTIDRDPGRYVRIEIPADHARSLASDLLKAADRADTPTTVRLEEVPDMARRMGTA